MGVRRTRDPAEHRRISGSLIAKSTPCGAGRGHDPALSAGVCRHREPRALVRAAATPTTSRLRRFRVAQEGGSVRNMATVSAAESRQSGLTRRDAALILGAVSGTAGIGAAATTPVLSSRWYRRLNKPPWQPPGPVFGPVWSVIYALIAASMLVALAALLLMPYTIWIAFATALTWAIWARN
jgi:TspO/MBR family